MSLDRQMQRAIAAHFLYLRDLGITRFYRRESSGGEEFAGLFAAEAEPAQRSAAAEPAMPRTSVPQPSMSKETAIPRTAASAPPAIEIPIGPLVPPGKRAAALNAIREDLGDCHRCPLADGRNKIVFGDGDPNARLMFVGEGPGADEDAQGIPFVGRAGQLLTNMIAAMGLRREQVYIANIVKCRPPQNRVPEPREANACLPFLLRQIDVVRPEVVIALGSTAALYLLGVRSSLAALRGRVHSFRGTRLIVTYHPAYLLRDPRQKKEAWRDLQMAMAELGMSPPAR